MFLHQKANLKNAVFNFIHQLPVVLCVRPIWVLGSLAPGAIVPEQLLELCVFMEKLVLNVVFKLRKQSWQHLFSGVSLICFFCNMAEQRGVLHTPRRKRGLKH